MYLVLINTIYKLFVHCGDRCTASNELLLAEQHIEAFNYCLLSTPSYYYFYFIPITTKINHSKHYSYRYYNHHT